MLDAALALLERDGYQATSMGKLASTARMSKETLYAWFGDRAGLFEALVTREARNMNRDLARALDSDGEVPREVLTRFGKNLLRLLLGPRALAINRAAIAAAAAGHPELGRILSARGRETTRPLVERYLSRETDAGRLNVTDPQQAFENLIGLLTTDQQIRALLGSAKPPTATRRRRHAEAAVDAFLKLY